MCFVTQVPCQRKDDYFKIGLNTLLLLGRIGKHTISSLLGVRVNTDLCKAVGAIATRRKLND